MSSEQTAYELPALSPPSHAPSARLSTPNPVRQLKERWARWRKEDGKLWVEMAGSCVTTLLVGMSDSATGANLPSMQDTYDVTYTIISLVFLANVAGYFVSCISNSFLLHYCGLRNSLLLADSCHAIGSLILSQRPPFPVAALALAFLGAGSGLLDTSLTTVISHHESGPIMSLVYSFFGIGATISPFIIGSFIDRGIDWNKYYYIPFALAIAFGFIHILIFSEYDQPSDSSSTTSLSQPSIHLTPIEPLTLNSNINIDPASSKPTPAQASLEALPPAPSTGREPSLYASESPRERLRASMKYPMVWLGAFLVVMSFAAANIYGNWLPTYLLDIKSASPTSARYSLAALWGGIALGRVVLAYPSSRFGEKPVSMTSLVLFMVALAILWKVKDVQAEQGIVFASGFCLGPVTPNAISLTTSRVPPSLKSSVVSILIGLGLVGSAAGPLLLGLASQRTSLVILPGVLIVLSCVSVGGLALVRVRARLD